MRIAWNVVAELDEGEPRHDHASTTSIRIGSRCDGGGRAGWGSRPGATGWSHGLIRVGRGGGRKESRPQAAPHRVRAVVAPATTTTSSEPSSHSLATARPCRISAWAECLLAAPGRRTGGPRPARVQVSGAVAARRAPAGPFGAPRNRRTRPEPHRHVHRLSGYRSDVERPLSTRRRRGSRRRVRGGYRRTPSRSRPGSPACRGAARAAGASHRRCARVARPAGRGAGRPPTDGMRM